MPYDRRRRPTGDRPFRAPPTLCRRRAGEERGSSPRPSAEADGLVLEQGRIIAKKYVLDRLAGFGGMAQLWVATNQATGAEVCVKVLVPDPEQGGHDEELVARFRREAHAAASLSHRAIVRVFDLLEIDEKGAAITDKTREPYGYAIVMELLRGETLGDVLAKRGTIPTKEALDLFLPILSALGHAHRASIIHRDLKPDNIFLATEPDGHVIPKVLDFGVSKLEGGAAITIDGVVVGTPSFMSPEQAKGSRSIDARSDVFSAGILFYMMLGGRNPFDDGSTFASTVEAVLRREVPPIPELAPEIWSVIERAIQKDPAGRFGDATEMSIALRKASGRRAPTESDPNIALPAISSRSVPEPGSGAGTNDSTPGSNVVSLGRRRRRSAPPSCDRRRRRRGERCGDRGRPRHRACGPERIRCIERCSSGGPAGPERLRAHRRRAGRLRGCERAGRGDRHAGGHRLDRAVRDGGGQRLGRAGRDGGGQRLGRAGRDGGGQRLGRAACGAAQCGVGPPGSVRRPIRGGAAAPERSGPKARGGTPQGA